MGTNWNVKLGVHLGANLGEIGLKFRRDGCCNFGADLGVNLGQDLGVITLKLWFKCPQNLGATWVL